MALTRFPLNNVIFIVQGLIIFLSVRLNSSFVTVIKYFI